ncbi:MAG: sugar transferase [Actinobacteria bacterium]|nr:sugar transferase [Actinomycetota bacterium]
MAVRSVTPLLEMALVFGVSNLLGLEQIWAAVFAAVSGLVLNIGGAPRLLPRLADTAAGVFGRVAVGALIAGPFMPTLSLPAYLRLGFAATGAALVARALGQATVRALRSRGIGLEPVAIVGAGVTGQAVARILERRKEYGLEPVGFIDDVDDGDDLALPVLGRTTNLDVILLANRIRHAIVAFGATREEEMVGVLRDCRDVPARFHILPRFFELGVARANPHADDLWGFPLVPLQQPLGWRLARHGKRVFDATFSALLLVLALPVMTIIALIVKAEDRGPVLFKQTRVGKDGRPFTLLKFRTMAQNSDSDTQWSVDDDDRVTRIGGFLRPTHLDELPQLINVLRGDMSLVGPRPERPHFVDQFSQEIPRYGDRLRMKAGMTGWAQVHGLWGDTSIEDRARFDNRYIENWSLWYDLVILARTVPTLFGRR